MGWFCGLTLPGSLWPAQEPDTAAENGHSFLIEAEPHVGRGDIQHPIRIIREMREIWLAEFFTEKLLRGNVPMVSLARFKAAAESPTAFLSATNSSRVRRSSGAERIAPSS